MEENWRLSVISLWKFWHFKWQQCYGPLLAEFVWGHENSTAFVGLTEWKTCTHDLMTRTDCTFFSRARPECRSECSGRSSSAIFGLFFVTAQLFGKVFLQRWLLDCVPGWGQLPWMSRFAHGINGRCRVSFWIWCQVPLWRPSLQGWPWISDQITSWPLSCSLGF